jgi:hypothetical protein
MYLCDDVIAPAGNLAGRAQRPVVRIAVKSANNDHQRIVS